jgi:hypothetical protein
LPHHCDELIKREVYVLTLAHDSSPFIIAIRRFGIFYSTENGGGFHARGRYRNAG